MQRVIPNEGLTAQEFQTILEDLGFSVAQTYPSWNVEKLENEFDSLPPNLQQQQLAATQPHLSRRTVNNVDMLPTSPSSRKHDRTKLDKLEDTESQSVNSDWLFLFLDLKTDEQNYTHNVFNLVP
ncbi:MAG: hypothetical protein R3C11_17005 [Planctomycetaceae bacterium]